MASGGFQSHIPRLSNIRPASTSNGNLKRSRSQSSRSSLNVPSSVLSNQRSRSTDHRGSSIGQRTRSSSSNNGRSVGGTIFARSSFASRISEGERRNRKDTRPLSDRDYQKGCMQKLSGFLREYNFDRHHPISTKMIQSPSAKEFQSMFQFIYQHISESFVLSENPVDEIPAIIKSLHYPYNLSRSHLMNPGSRQSWSHLLSFLTWLIDAVIYCRLYQVPMRKDQYEAYVENESEFDNKTLLEFFYQRSSEVFTNLVTHGGEIDLDQEKFEIKTIVDDYMQVSPEEMEALNEGYIKLLSDLAATEKEMNHYKKIEDLIKNYQNDKVCYSQYNEEMRGRIESKKREIADMEILSSDLKEQLKVAKEENEEVKVTLKSQTARGLSAKVLAANKDQLLKDLSDWEEKLAAQNEKKWDKELVQLNSHNKFNEMCSQLEDIRQKLLELLKNNGSLYDSFPQKAALDKFLNFHNLLEVKVSPPAVLKLQEVLPALLTNLKNHFQHNGTWNILEAISKEEEIVNEFDVQIGLFDLEINDLSSRIATDKEYFNKQNSEFQIELNRIQNKITKLRKENLEANNNMKELEKLQQNEKELEERITIENEQFLKRKNEILQSGNELLSQAKENDVTRQKAIDEMMNGLREIKYQLTTVGKI